MDLFFLHCRMTAESEWLFIYRGYEANYTCAVCTYTETPAWPYSIHAVHIVLNLIILSSLTFHHSLIAVCSDDDSGKITFLQLVLVTSPFGSRASGVQWWGGNVSAVLRGASPVFSGEEDTGLPNSTSTARTPQYTTLSLATLLPNLHKSRQVGAV